MKKLTTLLFALFPSLLLAENTLNTEVIIAKQKPNTRYIEINVRTKAKTDDPFLRKVKIITSYTLECENESFTIEHMRESGNFENPNINNGYEVYYAISNKTDDATHVNGYQMFRAWEYLLKNPDKKVYCQLKYQSKAGFSPISMSVTAGSQVLPISSTINFANDNQLSTLKSQTIVMLPPENVNEGGSGPCIAHCTPLLIDMNQDGFQLGEVGIGVEFDLTATQTPQTLQWVANNTDDAFLAQDLNHNGIIDNGAELFGSGTDIISANHTEKAVNGFIALAQHDMPQLGGNDDGYITQDDGIWAELLLWNDNNADGISQQNEIIPINKSPLRKLNIIPKTKDFIDDAGNKIPLWSWVYGDSRKHKYEMVDVYFKVLATK